MARLRSGMVPDGHYIGAARWRQFGLDFAAFWAKNGKKGPKLASSGYLSVNYVFLYSVHSFRLT